MDRMDGDFDKILRLVKEQRSDEAMAVAERAEDSDARLLRIAKAAIHLMQGEVDESCRLSRQLIEDDEFDATARFINGFCRTSQGDETGAFKQYRAAAYLDPRFALPHIQLGMTARRSGKVDEARREFQHAIRLLHEDHPWRITLLGGGFDAAGLIRVCQRELRALEGIE